jgi:hypothetical protein
LKPIDAVCILIYCTFNRKSASLDGGNAALKDID